MLDGIASGSNVLASAAGLAALALIGGLVVLAFTKLYGTVFLGSPRTHEVAESSEADTFRIAAMALPLAGILFVGLFPRAAVSAATRAAGFFLRTPADAADWLLSPPLAAAGRTAWILIAVVCLLLWLRRRTLRTRTVAKGPTWGCGFTAPNVRMQYTGESFSEGLQSIATSLTQNSGQGSPWAKAKSFPAAHSFDIGHRDRIGRLFAAWWVELLRVINQRVCACARARSTITSFSHWLSWGWCSCCRYLTRFKMAALNTLLLLLAALAIPGLINRTRALARGPQGHRFAQHLYDVRLLLRKGAVYSPTTTAVFRAAPSVTLGTALVAALFVPVGDLPSALSFEGDLIAFAYLLALAGVALILAAMDTGSSFEGMGASREALYGALVEPALMLVFGTLALLSGYTSFDAIFSGDAVNGVQLVVVLLLAAYVLVKIVFTEAGASRSTTPARTSN